MTNETFRGVPLLRLAGSLVREADMRTLKAAAASVRDTRHAAMVLDLAELKTIDFAGLGVLLELGGLAGRLFLLRTPEPLRSKILRAHVDTMFSLVADERELNQAMDVTESGRSEDHDE